MKPYYEKDGLTIYHGDCREILPEIGPVDVTLTDPPWKMSTEIVRGCTDAVNLWAAVATLLRTRRLLVKRAAKWLRSKHAVIITEMAGQPEEPDAIGFSSHWTTLVECKASRADFAADKQKKMRRAGDFRYYLVPAGLVETEECPRGWGLLYAGPRRVYMVVRAPQAEDVNHRTEQELLVSALRRIKAPVECVSVKWYTYETHNRATVGVEVTTQLEGTP